MHRAAAASLKSRAPYHPYRSQPNARCPYRYARLTHLSIVWPAYWTAFKPRYALAPAIRPARKHTRTITLAPPKILQAVSDCKYMIGMRRMSPGTAPMATWSRRSIARATRAYFAIMDFKREILRHGARHQCLVHPLASVRSCAVQTAPHHA